MTTELTTRDRVQALAVATESIIAEWLEYERQEGASANTLSAYRKGIGVFVAWLQAEDVGADLVMPQTIRQFKADLAETYSAQTVNLRLSAVRSFYRFCVNTDRLPYNPAAEVKGVKRPKSKMHRRDALANGEVLAVLETCDLDTAQGLRDRAILGLMAYCALREIEIHRANVGNLKTQGDRLVLEVQGKGRLEADEIVIVPPQEEPVMRAWLALRLTTAEYGGAMRFSSPCPTGAGASGWPCAPSGRWSKPGIRRPAWWATRRRPTA